MGMLSSIYRWAGGSVDELLETAARRRGYRLRKIPEPPARKPPLSPEEMERKRAAKKAGRKEFKRQQRPAAFREARRNHFKYVPRRVAETEKEGLPQAVLALVGKFYAGYKKMCTYHCQEVDLTAEQYRQEIDRLIKENTK